jgi:uncharacterized phiE125 gp8 family phage protein
MDYRRNEDRLHFNSISGLSYNQQLDISWIEPSGGFTEPVTLEEAKQFCKIDFNDDDDLIEMLITAAREMCEDYTNIGFVSREITSVINNGNGGFYLSLGPVTSEVIGYDKEDNEIELDVSGSKFKQVIHPKLHLMTVEYIGGYEVLPMKLKTGLLNAIFYLYDNRATGEDNIGPIAQMILNPYRRVW